jgi:hypothetical protein
MENMNHLRNECLWIELASLYYNLPKSLQISFIENIYDFIADQPEYIVLKCIKCCDLLQTKSKSNFLLLANKTLGTCKPEFFELLETINKDLV